MSYLSSGLHFDPERPAGLPAGLSAFLHSGFFFRSLPAFSLTAFPFDTFVLNRYFSMSARPALFYSLILNVHYRASPVSNKSLSPLLSLMLLFVARSSKVPLSFFFSCKFGTFFFFFFGKMDMSGT